MRIVIASKNEHKVAEVERVLASLVPWLEVVGGMSWPDVEESADTLIGNALLKARAVAKATGVAALADDTGLFINSLDGDPGVRSARFAGEDATDEDNVDKVLRSLNGVQDRSARFVTVIACVTPDLRELVVEGVLQGAIGRERLGSGGFGYDPIFFVDGRTLAQRSPEEKAQMSHRGRALRAFAAQIGNKPLIF
ncbi:MAG: RdgB/HAM1 family non-canonical purine NTP pyrophosphatase [Acidobacteria bacterium]|nr:RdgB/HAM1 family non-canonical purine NTP pyrophosphatase [Acidobacteriota bacterium]